MGTVSDLVAEIQASGFDVTPTDALILLDRRHKQMCSRARWWRETRNVIATTLTDYNISTVVLTWDTVELFSVASVATDGLSSITFHRTNADDINAMLAGTLWLSGTGGVFIESATTDTTGTPPVESIALYPAVANGAGVQLQGAFLPPTLTTAETSGAFIRIPADFYDALLAGVYATLLGRPNESRPDLAGVQEALFSAGCDELRDRAGRRFKTRGPRQIRVGGVDI